MPQMAPIMFTPLFFFFFFLLLSLNLFIYFLTDNKPLQHSFPPKPSSPNWLW